MADRYPSHNPATTFAPLSRLDDFEVADDSVDVRGWKVTGVAGADIGKVDDLLVDASTMKAHYLVIDLDRELTKGTAGIASDDPVLVPVSRARILDDDKRVQLDSAGGGLASLPRYRGEPVDRDYNEQFKRAEAPGRAASGEQRVTRSAEELRIGKRKVSAGEATVAKHVETERVKKPVTRTREEVTVERRPVSSTSGTANRRAEIGEDEVRIPLSEEELVVEKRPVVKEELVVGKREVQERDTVETDLRRERVDIEQDAPRERAGDPKRRGEV